MFRFTKYFLVGSLVSFLIGLMIVFAIDAEIARRDRAENGNAKQCLFAINCR